MQVGKILSWFNPHNAKYKSFKDFWPHYVDVHKNDKVSNCHLKATLAGLATGTTGATATAAGSLISGVTELLLLVPPAFVLLWAGVTYPFVIRSHKKYDNEMAASLENIKHAWWSIRGDFTMVALKLRGKWEKELERLGINRKETTSS